MTKEEVYSVAEDYIYYGRKNVSINDLEQQLYYLKDAHGFFLLGEIYYRGIDREKNMETALGFYKQASPMGDAYASYRLGYILEHGEVGGIDCRQAAWNYMLAYTNGLREALTDMARCCQTLAKSNGYEYSKRSADVKAEIAGDYVQDKWSNRPVMLRAPKGYYIGMDADDADKQEIVIDRCTLDLSYVLKSIYTGHVIKPESKYSFLIDAFPPEIDIENVKLENDTDNITIQNNVIYSNSNLKISVPVRDGDSGVQEKNINISVMRNGKREKIDTYELHGNTRDGYILTFEITESGYYYININVKDRAGNVSNLTFDQNNQYYKGIVIDKEIPKINVRDVYEQQGVINLEISVDKSGGVMGIKSVAAGIGGDMADITPAECRNSMLMRVNTRWKGVDTGRDYVCIMAEDYLGNKAKIFHDGKPVKDVHSQFDFMKQAAPRAYKYIEQAETAIRTDYNIGKFVRAAFEEMINDLCRQNGVYVPETAYGATVNSKKFVAKLNDLAGKPSLGYLNDDISYEAVTGRRCRGSKMFFLREIGDNTSQGMQETQAVEDTPRKPMPGYATSLLALETLYGIAVKIYGGDPSSSKNYDEEHIPLRDKFYVEKSYIPKYAGNSICSKEMAAYSVSDIGHKDFYIVRAYAKKDIEKQAAEEDNARLNSAISANGNAQLVYDSELAGYDSERSDTYYLVNKWR